MSDFPHAFSGRRSESFIYDKTFAAERSAVILTTVLTASCRQRAPRENPF
jgi:hypothetical protein